ncbi:class C beta-lactamase [Solimicrobium silvestre]|uniref:Beta-lactamase n=1 Tax=Solimicrobium silvestre TaxID=2099400 RepID=A0A2S9H403_9BURK|nr:class C beta-lactamase [Solimicrobium silvestre]PRC94700.1 Beta-lactamase [Solimicrobium silvestre]
MRQNTVNTVKKLSVLACFIAGTSFAAVNTDQPKLQDTVDDAIKPLLQKYNIAGMAIAISFNGENYFYNYGVASKDTKQPVTNATLFEIGSLSKTFTATLASYAQANGQLNLSDPVSKYLPNLRGSSFDKISLLNLGTHTAGNFPLQVPDSVQSYDQLMDYYKHFQSSYKPGTYRTYSNPGVGLLGIVTAKSMNMPFDDAMEKILFPALGMKNSYINVPAEQMGNYAQGYNKADKPVRVNPDILASEAYGVKTNTVDLIRFINANMQQVQLDEKLQNAIVATHTGYFKAGEIIQDLIWEQYPDTAKLKQMVAGNSPTMINEDTAATKLSPPLAPQSNVFLNKTGSTGGFGAYALYVPAKKIGIVILANKSYPNDARVTAAYEILKKLDVQIPANK